MQSTATLGMRLPLQTPPRTLPESGECLCLPWMQGCYQGVTGVLGSSIPVGQAWQPSTEQRPLALTSPMATGEKMFEQEHQHQDVSYKPKLFSS